MPFLCFSCSLVCLSLSPGQRTERAKIAANARWGQRA